MKERVSTYGGNRKVRKIMFQTSSYIQTDKEDSGTITSKRMLGK
jgi:hypothetical protein